MAADEPTIRHVLFCVADQWRADALGCIGTPGVVTPHLDRLAAESVVFANHWCQASPCGPSRSSLLTGTHLPTHGQWTNDDPANPSLPSLGATLRSAGVDPLLVGYTDTPFGDGLIDPSFTVALPFIWQDGFPTWRAELARRGYDIDHDHPLGLYAPDGEPDARTGRLAPARYGAADSDVAFLTDAALAVIGDWSPADSARSLLHLNWLRPHPPMTPPRPYDTLVDLDAVAPARRPLAVNDQLAVHPYFEQTIPNRSMTEYLQVRSNIDDVGEREERAIRAAYYGLCAEVDHHVGRVIAELRRRGLYDTTLIIVTSDHGDALGDHWIYGRRGPFDGHFKVPCIIRDPRASAAGTRGTTVDDFTANVDLFPTICEALGVATPSTVEGRSLTDHLSGLIPNDWRDGVTYAMSWDDHLRSAVRQRSRHRAKDRRFTVHRTNEHRLIEFPNLPPLLFDLVEDPDETVNRSTLAR